MHTHTHTQNDLYSGACSRLESRPNKRRCTVHDAHLKLLFDLPPLNVSRGIEYTLRSTSTPHLLLLTSTLEPASTVTGGIWNTTGANHRLDDLIGALAARQPRFFFFFFSQSMTGKQSSGQGVSMDTALSTEVPRAPLIFQCEYWMEERRELIGCNSMENPFPRWSGGLVVVVHKGGFGLQSPPPVSIFSG